MPLGETNGDGSALGCGRTVLYDVHSVFRLASKLKGGHNPQGGARQFERSQGSRGQAFVPPWRRLAYFPSTKHSERRVEKCTFEYATAAHRRGRWEGGYLTAVVGEVGS